MSGREVCRVVTWDRVKLALAIAVALLPGGLVVLLGWVLARSLVRAHSLASARQANSGPRLLWRTLAEVDFRQVVREARAAL